MKYDPQTPPNGGQGLSRRAVVSGLAAFLAVPTLARHAHAAVARRQVPAAEGAAASPIPRQGHATVALPSGLVLVTGGYYLGPLSSAQFFDPTDGTWLDVRPMNLPRYQHMSALLPDGRVLVSGGLYQDVLSDAEIHAMEKHLEELNHASCWN